MVLAAGLGNRLRPVTDRIAKPAVPFFGRPILLHTLDRLAEAGFSEAIVNTHHRREDIEALAGEAPIPMIFSHEPEILGTGGGLAKVRPLFEGQDEVVMVNGDVVFDLPIETALEAHRASGAGTTLILLPNPDPSRYGRVVANTPFGSKRFGERLRRVDQILGPRAEGEGFLFAGVSIASRSVLDRLPAGPSEIVPTLWRPLAAEGALAAYVANGLWYELGTPADLLAAHLDLMRRIFAGRREAARLATRIVDRPLRFDRELRSALHPRSRIEGKIDEVVVNERCAIDENVEAHRALLLPGARLAAGAAVRDRVVLAD
jgi:mannose-1-phosphate guanylyltransferase